jgi:hypothetical protein
MTHPLPAIPILASEDYELLQRAVSHYLANDTVRESPDSQKYANLGQRLGSMARNDRRNELVWE